MGLNSDNTRSHTAKSCVLDPKGINRDLLFRCHQYFGVCTNTYIVCVSVTAVLKFLVRASTEENLSPKWRVFVWEAVVCIPFPLSDV